MAFKWTEGDHVTSNIVDADQFNSSFNNVKGEINGGLDRENLPNGSISNEELSPNAFVKYAIVTGVRAQNTEVLLQRQQHDNSGVILSTNLRAISHNTYTGGWITNTAQNIESVFQEGMLHVEFNCWYWLLNALAGGNTSLKTLQFRLLFDNMPIADSGIQMQATGQVHIVTDIPVSTGQHKIEIQWKTTAFNGVGSAFVVNPTVPITPMFYYDGGQILVVNRYR